MLWEQGALSCPRKGVTSPLPWPRAPWTHAFSHFFSDSLLWARRLGWGQVPGLLAQSRGIQLLLSNGGGGRRSGRRRSSVAAGAGGVRAGAQVPEDSLNSLFLCSEPRNGPQKALSTLGPGAQAGSPPVHRGSSGSFRGPAGQSRETGRPHSLLRGWEGRKEARG